MEKRKKYMIGLVLILIVLAVGIFFVISMVRNSSKNGMDDIPVYTPEGEIAQEIEDPDVIESESQPTGDTSNSIDNSDVSESLKPSEEMEKVITENKDNLNNTEVVDQMAQSYPSNLIPLYKAKSAADSSDIVTDNGNPGWTAQYGSDATVPEISQFYEDLLGSTNGYKSENESDSKRVVGTIDNCLVTVTVSPNNPERTGLDDQSNVDIFIERR